MSNHKNIWLHRRRRLCEILEAGSSEDTVSRIYDVFTVLVPKGDLMLLEGDRVILYTQEKFAHASTITL